MLNDDRKVVLAFFAHPDDAEIFAGGTLTLLSERGYEIHILTATAGDCGSATLSREEIAATRRKEGAAAAAMVGGTYHCLLENDLQVCYETKAIQKAIDVFREVNPTLVLTHPRYDYMLDHEQVHLLARAATFGFAIPNASTTTLPDEARVPYLYYTDPMEGRDPYSGEMVKESVMIDVSEVMDTKSAMLACHVSQREWLRSHHGIDEYLIAMQRFAEQRGGLAGYRFAEAFTQHRGHPYPQDDLLNELLMEGND